LLGKYGQKNINMTSRERKYHINKRLRKLLWEEITRVIDEDIVNQLNGEEPNSDIQPMI